MQEVIKVPEFYNQKRLEVDTSQVQSSFEPRIYEDLLATAVINKVINYDRRLPSTETDKKKKTNISIQFAIDTYTHANSRTRMLAVLDRQAFQLLILITFSLIFFSSFSSICFCSVCFFIIANEQ